MPADGAVYSIGHSSLPIEAFLSHLTRFGIVLVADVRRFPGSRRHPQFERDALERSLARASIGYLHLGDQLGGFRDLSYEAHVKSEAFRSGLRSLEARLGPPVAVLCAEKQPWHCHRRFIAAELEGRGWVVRHIVDGQLLLGTSDEAR